ncbi:MAG: FHA domain-containing protein [Deltaproteobacteria bacterium]|nr:FHA domain-containing protein [Deltaproteobacteria bacterium]
MERLQDFIKVVNTLSMDEFVEQFPHAFFFYSKVPGVIDAFVHTRLVDQKPGAETIDRFSEQILDFIPLLPNPHRNKDFPKKAFVGRDERRDYVIAHTTVSNRHACLMYKAEDDSYLLVDSGSTNGTMVRGRALVPGEPVAVHDGDVITFGRLDFMFFSPRGAYRYMNQYRLFTEAMQAKEPG